ncbi:pyridoxal-phosphate dependent enzyme [Streptomyces sp. C8S0]|uniref:pyridoxal-phosphate dependent enzyme n=1 Tax=Streptomyces sp. C8S0 TaxID=2585716 RepID=UPI0039AEF109
MELENRTGSAKDRAAIWILREAMRRGEITRSTTVVESSSGNFALALASFLNELDVPFVPVLDPNVNAATERTLRQLCARVEKVTEPDGTGGYLLSRLARVTELRAELPDVYWPNQYSNPDGARGHYELTARELLEDVGRIDYLFVGSAPVRRSTASRRLGEEHRMPPWSPSTSRARPSSVPRRPAGGSRHRIQHPSAADRRRLDQEGGRAVRAGRGGRLPGSAA